MSSSGPSATSVSSTVLADQVTAMLDELERRWPGATDRLRQQTLEELATFGEVRVKQVPESEVDQECSVAGAYLAEETPPVLAVAGSVSQGRRAFTALHELGHHLQQTTIPLIDVLVDQADDGRTLEEAACNSFAADILIPAAVLRRHIGENTPTAHNIVDLWRDRDIDASRQAVCARAGERLRSPGHVLLLDREGLVTFAMSRGLPPLRRGLNQSRIPIVSAALGDPSRAHQGLTALAYRDQITGTGLHAQTKDMGGYVVVVAVLDRAPWEDRFTLPTAETGPTAQWWTCSKCDHSFYAFRQRCQRCRAPKCEECGQCDCPAVAERLCTGCFTVYPLRMFTGDSERCRDCV